MTSNTDAAQLAETFAVAKCPTKVFLLADLDFCHFVHIDAKEGLFLNLYIWDFSYIHNNYFKIFINWFNFNLQFINYGSWILQVVGVPVTLNGDLKNQFVETNVGFDTICKVFVL